MVCVDCGARREMSVPDAKREMWDLWPGGGRCRACRAKTNVAFAPLPDVTQSIVLERMIVRCTHCGREIEASNEFDNGWRPNVHWLTTEENKRALRESKTQIPLCPGREVGGEVIRILVWRPVEKDWVVKGAT